MVRRLPSCRSRSEGRENRRSTFASVAARPDFDPAKLAFFLLDPHPKMPNMQLSRDEASDIAAYIATLK
jgi:hypothetical protein